jgi:PAS domain S-box-containing protein
MSLHQSIVSDAARLLGSPVALLGFLDTNGERIAAAHGWTVSLLPASSSFAPRLGRDVVTVADASQDSRFADHPLVTGPPHVRFYAGAPILGAGGDVTGALSVLDRSARTISPGQVEVLRILARHVSHELALRDEAAEANERFREFFENTDDLVMSIAANGDLLHANETALRLLGIARGTSILRVIEIDRRDAFRHSFEALLFTGEPQRVETTFVTASGARITVEGSLRAKLVNGRPYLARVVFRDISDRKQFETELGNARDAALEAARLKTQFLTNVSHEIRTPMNGIVGMVDLLLATRLDAEQQDFAHQARASAEQLLSIVNNILYVSAIEAGSLSQSAVDFDLLRTLQRIVEVMRIASLGKELDVRLTYDDALPPIFRGNQARLRQVVTNLLDNAVKFTEQGEVVLSVTQQTETETHRVVRFEVRDTGIGIAPEDRLLLFERFSQVEASSTRRYQGVGLGLATARQLVETMGGLMDVDSRPGYGSTFWFTVPFPKQPSSSRKPVASSDLEFRGKRVLLVDHLPTSRKIVRHYLETTWGMRVDVAGADALDVLRREAASDPYRVAVFESDPVPFARAVRGDARLAATSLVHLTPPNAEVNAALLREAGIHAYVSRPVGQADLFDAMTLALAQDAIPLARAASQPFDRRPAPGAVDPEVRKSVRVLLAEDNFLNMKLTMSQLQKLGYVADSVANGKEALEALETKDYAIVLMDCQMPIVDGYEAAMETRRREKNGAPRRYIIAMTANALEGDREKCLAAGMDDYLAKPTKAEELESALARYFSS